MTDAFVAALRAPGTTVQNALELLPPHAAWTPDALARAHAALNSAPALAAVLKPLLAVAPTPPVAMAVAVAAEDEEMPSATGYTSSTDSDREGDAGARDDRSARADAADKIRRQSARYHIARFAARYFRLTESVDREDGTKCAVWAPCAALAEVLGMRAGRELAGNGTHFKATCADTEAVGRFVATHHAWMDTNEVGTESVPLRVAREGAWPDRAAVAAACRDARYSVLRYAAEMRTVIALIREVFAQLDAAHTSGGPEAVLSLVAGLDRRRRGREDRLKLPYRRLSDEDSAFARTMLPLAAAPGRAATDARRVLAVLHSLRVMAWRHTDEPFPGVLFYKRMDYM